MPKEKLFLLDGHALMYRAHYAFISRPLINSKGVNTSAVTGFTRVLWDLMRNQHPHYLAVAFDLPGPTFRHEAYEPYKANRESQPEDITSAIPYIHRILKGFKIPIVTKEGFEADDVIGTLAKQAEKEGMQVYMMTPDKDFGQLVSENIFLYKPARMGNDVEIMGVEEVKAKWDIDRIDQVIDMLGLIGDSVDNIPGIPGIGPKTAIKLLKDFGTVEGLLENVESLKGKQKENVINFAEQGLLSKQLATIDINVPIKFNAEEYRLDPPDKEMLAEVFKELEFRTLATQILGTDETEPVHKPTATQGSLFGNAEMSASVAPTPLPSHSIATKNLENTSHSYHLVDNLGDCQALAKKLASEKTICFDTETTNIDPNLAELVGMSFAIKPGEAWYISIPEDRVDAYAIVDLFKPILEDETIVKIAQNIKYDAIVMKWYDVEVKGLYQDTMIAHYLLEPELRHNMDYLSETYLKYKPVSISSLIGKGKNQLSMRDIPVEKVSDYAAEDADITLQLKEYLFPKMEKEGLKDLYDTIEEPLIKALVDLEFEGVNVDANYLNIYSKELGTDIDKAEATIYEKAGVRFNIASPKQVGEVLFEKLKIPYRWSKTKSGQYSTDEEKLAELSQEFEIVNDILRFRGLSKLKSTYVDALPKMINPKTGRIHSSFNQALTATGRLSSNNPNLQNIPVRTPEGARVRKAFIPRDKNHVLLAADYSQIELRLIAEMSGETAMQKAFIEGKDIHRATAAGVFDVPYDEVNREQRYRAKTVNFSIIYGAGATNLSRQLNLKRAEAKTLIESYFKQYPGLRLYMDKTVADARENGYVMTMMGRRRHLRDINSRNGMIRSGAERNAINTPIQGTAADMIKIAMANIHQALKKSHLKTKMILQVHDELVFDVPKGELEEVKLLVDDKMKNAIPGLKVPIVVDMGVGEDWLEAH
ncbi:MAG: DNA polymerase I [Saprospiraceae bacterium]|nr:DNA polymerase I [Saprospiraceae bacterium]MCB9325270.1 DNA polymerase I [Lewinellaceae bacterium]